MVGSMRIILSLRVIFILILSLTLFSCGKPSKPVGSATLEPRCLWLKHATQTYVIEQARVCFCPGPNGFVQLTVVNNQIVKGVTTDSGDSLTIEELKWYKTVDELFEFIDEVEGCKPAVLQVDYDPDFGYPRNVYVDMHLEMVDEEIGFNTRLVQLSP
jgi:hypothetical protein